MDVREDYISLEDMHEDFYAFFKKVPGYSLSLSLIIALEVLYSLDGKEGRGIFRMGHDVLMRLATRLHNALKLAWVSNGTCHSQ